MDAPTYSATRTMRNPSRNGLNLLSVLPVLLLTFGLTAALRADAPSAAARDTLAAQLADLKRRSQDLRSLREFGGQLHFKDYTANPVLKPGRPGNWDAASIGSMSVLKVGEIFHLYYEAWGATWSGQVDYTSLQIGHAVSYDGLTWAKDPANPVLPAAADSQWDHAGTWDPFVLFEDGKFKMWYGGGCDPHCEWGYAESSDGSRFARKGKISNLGRVEDDHVIHDPTTKRYYMYYWDRRHEPDALFRAEAADETHFDFARVVPIRIDGERPGMYKFTHVIREGDTWFMFYSNFVRPHCADSTVRLASSPDGLKWTSRRRDLTPGQDGEILKVEDGLYILYYGPQGRFDAPNGDVRAAVLRSKLADLVSHE